MTAKKVGLSGKDNGAGVLYGSEEMSRHMAGKFYDTHRNSLYNMFGNADGTNMLIISQMIADRAKKEDRKKIQYVLKGD
jgi:hypothetical protein